MTKRLTTTINQIGQHINRTCARQRLNIPSDEDDEDRAFKEIDDLYEYVRSGILPEYLKANELLITSRSKLNNNINSFNNNNNNNNNGIVSNIIIGSSHENHQQQHQHQNQQIQHQSQQYQQQQQNNHHHQQPQQQQQQYQHQQQQNQQHHHLLLSQQHLNHLVSSVTAVTTATVSAVVDDLRDHSELFDVSTTTNTRRTFKMSQKNSENFSGNSSFRVKKGKGE